jgi:hypothetical protein
VSLSGCRRTNQPRANPVLLCARLVRLGSTNFAHPVDPVREVRHPTGVKMAELTNRAHPPIPPRGACGQLAAAPEPTARAWLVRAGGSRFARLRQGAIRVVGPCGGETWVAQWANPADRTRHGRTWAAWAGREREGAGQGRRHRYFPGGMASRRPREQPQSPTEFVSPVRSAPQALARPAPGRPTLARVAPGGGLPIQPPILPTGPARANVARRSAGLLTPIPNPEARRPLP